MRLVLAFICAERAGQRVDLRPPVGGVRRGDNHANNIAQNARGALRVRIADQRMNMAVVYRPLLMSN